MSSVRNSLGYLCSGAVGDHVTVKFRVESASTDFSRRQSLSFSFNAYCNPDGEISWTGWVLGPTITDGVYGVYDLEIDDPAGNPFVVPGFVR
jgi:hypothetical protein